MPKEVLQEERLVFKAGNVTVEYPRGESLRIEEIFNPNSPGGVERISRFKQAAADYAELSNQ
ncbi:MAG: hypothetical protein AAB521_04815 [Patescibacteria group bacterium]